MAHLLFLSNALPLAAGGLRPFWHFSGAFHPVTVHFPIALLLVAALLEGIALLRRRRRPRAAAVTCLWLGAVGAVVAAILGWANADAAGEFAGELAPIVSAHRWLGVALVALALVTAIAATLARRRPRPALLHAYRGGVFAAAALDGLVGSYGGKITYGPGHYEDAFKTLMAALQAPALKTPTDLVDAASAADLATASLAAASTSRPSPDLPHESADASPGVLATSQAVMRPTSATEGTPATAQAMTRVDFARDVQPILLTTCVKCHTRRKRMGRYRLDDRQHMLLPGESGTPPILPGRGADSLLVKLIEGKGEHAENRMPPKGPPLTGEQIALIRRWIDEGAE